MIRAGLFHKILAQDIVVVVSVVFAVVVPLVLYQRAMFCLFLSHHVDTSPSYVYESVLRVGPPWPKIFRRFVFII
jgi:hypothetical protein